MGHAVSAGDAWVLYGFAVLAVLCIPLAYRMGQISGEEKALKTLRRKALKASLTTHDNEYSRNG